MPFVMIPANTYLLMLIVYIVSSIQVILLGWAIRKLRNEVGRVKDQNTQSFRLVAHGQEGVTNNTSAIFHEVKKGNKDQQEIKTKLTNLRQLVEKQGANPVYVIKKGAKNVAMTAGSVKTGKK